MWNHSSCVTLNANVGRRKENIDINVKLGYTEIKTLVNDTINDKVYQEEHNNNTSPKFRRVFPGIKAKINLNKGITY